MDGKRAAAFASRVEGLVDQALVGLMISVGHRAGLFARLAASSGTTSAELAAVGGWQERQVREWLAAMAAARIVDHDGARDTYALPPEHRACLVGDGDTVAARAAVIARVAAAEEAVVGRLFGREAPAPDPALLPGVGGLELVQGLGERLRAGIDVADLGGRAGLAAAFPGSRFLALEPDALDGEARFDLVLCLDLLHAQPRPEELLRRALQALRPGGQLVCRELAASSHLADNLERPRAAALYALSLCASLPRGLAGGGAGLGLLWGQERALQLFARAGFAATALAGRPDSPHQYYVATRP